ncbi:ATP-binding protein [Streptomyces orinoci]|uniref:ATP-binding protein n=1 Tax=Streptomyces orinoci TaxID=67339 RepID=A0ABV3K1N3_STRON|nr:ATP-binding protein [Streptomyces orinoci]
MMPRVEARNLPLRPREQLILDAVEPSARIARDFAREVLANQHNRAGHIDDVVLVVSELVTNAVRYGSEPGDSLLVVLAADDRRTRIEVHDPSRRLPRMKAESHERGRGRGLHIVDALARWGTGSRPFGKYLWAEVEKS